MSLPSDGGDPPAPGRADQEAVAPACWHWLHSPASGGASNPSNSLAGAVVSGIAARRRAPVRPRWMWGTWA